jgi:large subunit ribosomal protein L10
VPREDKVQLVREFRDKIQGSSALILTDYRGLTVSDITALRRKLREAGAEYKVVKNTLFGLAAKDLGYEELSAYLSGPTAVAFIANDPVTPAKALMDFIREYKIPRIKGGLVDGRAYGPAQIEALSKIPPKEILVSQLLGSIQAPISGLVGTLQGLMSNLVYTLQAIADKKAA